VRRCNFAKTDLFVLDFAEIVLPSPPIAQNSEHNHYEQGHEDNDNRDFHECEQKSYQRDQLFQERHDQQNESDDRAKPTENSKNATTHVLTS